MNLFVLVRIISVVVGLYRISGLGFVLEGSLVGKLWGMFGSR